ncbi:hypothetical protein RHGRI_036926 [Rhododendron griersonianum]|uniref:Retrotransposon gag domain-containing protein n=1 Tax=Rhododendron griersonianum TaxID=479676 RepID=A0AAV6HT29_9ERIC|nr:hypothetical protein RHGRI_036926 [Rhododendron griersonianum]
MSVNEDVAQMKALLEKLAATGLESKLKAKAQASGSVNIPPQIPEYGPQRTVEDPQLTDVDRGAKLEVADFSGDHDPEVFFDWVHSIESFFRWYPTTEERKLLFAKAKLTGTARIWWTKFQRENYVAIHVWEDMKIAMASYFVPPSYKQRAHLQFTQLTQGSKSVEEYTRLFYSLATRSEFPWNEDVMISISGRHLVDLFSRLTPQRLGTRFSPSRPPLPSSPRLAPMRCRKSVAVIENEDNVEDQKLEKPKFNYQIVEPLYPESDEESDTKVIGIIRPLLASKGDKPNLEKLQRG